MGNGLKLGSACFLESSSHCREDIWGYSQDKVLLFLLLLEKSENVSRLDAGSLP